MDSRTYTTRTTLRSLTARGIAHAPSMVEFTKTTHAYHPYGAPRDTEKSETARTVKSDGKPIDHEEVKSIFCGSVQRQFNLLSDWVLIVVLIIGWIVMDGYVHPIKQCVPGEKNNPRCSSTESALLSYTNTHYTIPQNKLNVMSLGIHFGLAAVSILMNLLCEPSFRSQISIGLLLYHIEMYIRCTALFLMFNLIVTDMMKITFGVPRPNYKTFHLIDPHNARKSFPSGHTSQAFVTTFWYVLQSLSCVHNIINEDYARQVREAFLMGPSETIYESRSSMNTAKSQDSAPEELDAGQDVTRTLAVEANLHRQHSMNIIKFENIMFFYPVYYRLAPVCPALTAVIATFPLVFSVWVASTRVIDHFHTPTDVLGGIIVGCSVAFLVYSTYRMRDFSHLYYAYDDNAMADPDSLGNYDIASSTVRNTARADFRTDKAAVSLPPQDSPMDTNVHSSVSHESMPPRTL